MVHKVSEKSESSNLQRILFKAIKNWYLFAFALIISLAIVYLVDRYTSRVYSIQSSILVKEKSPELSSSAAELLYSNQVFQNSKNLNNESMILKSYPIIFKTIKNLQFNKVFYLHGNFKTTEVYENLALDVLIDTTSTYHPYNRAFTLKIIDKEHFEFFEDVDNDQVQINGRYRYNELINYNGFKFRVVKATGDNFVKNIGESYGFRIFDLDRITKMHIERLQIKPQNRESSILNLSLNSLIPSKDIDFLNELTKIYIQQGLDEKTTNAIKTVKFIDEQLEAIRDSLSYAERQLETFKLNNNAIDLGEEALKLYEQMQELANQSSALIIRNKYYEYLTNYLTESENLDDLITPSVMNIEDPVLNKLVLELVNLQVEKDMISQSNENPYVKVINEQIAALKKQIIENVNNLEQSDLIKKQQIDIQTRRVQDEMRSLPGAEREFINIKRMFKLSEDLYIFLMEKRAEAAIVKASTTPDVKVVNPPMVVGGPISPQTSKNFGIAIVLSFILPLVFIYVKEFFNTRIVYREDIDELTTIPFLGMVGHNDQSGNLVVHTNPKFPVSESFRTLRSNINFFTADQEKKTILITSSISGEGKTFCSINLALVFALSGKKTLIIGGDLRRPKIYNDFGLSNEHGLSNYLVNRSALEQIIQTTSIDNLDLISSGLVPPNPAELLMNKRMDRLMETLKERYDYIIMDTPPIGLVTDALILMKYSDMTVYLVRQNYTPKGTIINTQEMYANGQLKNISILFNDVKVQKYGYGYGYGYNYGYDSSYYGDNSKKRRKFRLFKK